MKKLGILVAVIGAFLASGAAMADVKILSVTGIVRVASAGGAEVVDATPGLVVANGSEIKTGENGRVTIETSPGNTLRLRENGKLLVLEPRPRENRVQFLAGKLKGVFKHLRGGERFSIEFSDNAVASVKGTEFTVEGGEGTVNINTIFGALGYSNGGRTVMIPQGCGAAVAGMKVKITPLNEGQIREGLRDWEDEQARDPQTGSTADMQMFAQSSADIAGVAVDQITQIREDDFAAGRTLRDVHGNVTRVDQRIMRPTANLISFVNLVKRDEYAYRGHYKYTGGSGARFDYLEASIRFNANLPTSLLDWPTFFGDNDNVEPDLMRVTMANGGPNDPAADRLVMTSKPVTVTTVQPWGTETKEEWQDTMQLTRNVGGVQVLTNIESDETVSSVGNNGVETDPYTLWGMTREGMYFDVNNDKVYNAGDVKFAMISEGYCIDNDGKNLSLMDFFNNKTLDPIQMMKTVAFEGIMAGEYSNGAPVMARGNIDIVVTPDIVLAVVSKLAAQIPTLMSGDN